MRRACFLAVLVATIGMAAAAEAATMGGETTLYLEAERFDDVGGWTIDAQFRQLMGSTYLLAAGIGEPVADASTNVRIPRAGTYRLWVRCKDWDKTSPGAFQVLINDLASDVTFGTQQKGWSWIAGGAFELPRGDAVVKLHDLTGYYGRCDALLLTTDGDFTPPDDVAATAALRDRLLGAPRAKTLSYDFVVIGGGYGGICSAVQAARLGLKTALVQNRPVLGGNASQEVNVGPGGASPHTSRFRETGLPEEIAEGRIRPDSKNWTDAANLLVKDVPNLAIYLNTEGTRPVMEGKTRIVAVEAENVVTGERYVFQAPLFADCTGDGAIAAAAGCAFRWGEEARDEFNESYAPEKATRHTMGTSMIHHSTKMETPQPFAPPPFAVKFTPEHFVKRKQNLVNGTWWIEYGGMIDTIQDAEEIRDELIRVIFGAFDWAKNHDPETRDQVTYHRLTRVPTVGGKRESRRFIGDYTLTQSDVENAPLFPDRVAWGGWPIDLHPAPGIYGKEIPPFTPFSLKQPYSIPYRILYPKELENLFLAGRHVSVTHVALGSTRLMQTIGTMGQAVGTAATLCTKYRTTPRGLYPHHIGEMQQLLLKWDAYIPEVSNRDPSDLCRGAKVTASSSLAGEGVSLVGTETPPYKDAPCTMARGQAVMATQPGRKTLQLCLRVTGDAPARAVLHVEKGDPALGKTEPLWKVEATVEKPQFHWVTFTLPDELPPGVIHFAWLAPSPGLMWRIHEESPGKRVYGSPGDWKFVGGLYSLRPFGAPVRLGKMGPEAAVDGLKWPLKEECHQWRSDPAQSLPQWLEVDFGKPSRVNTVALTWDTNIYGRFPRANAGNVVTAEHYRVLYRAGDRWKVAVEEKGNWRRFRRHTFRSIETTGLLLEILSAHGGSEARLYEIRAYQE